MEPNNPWDQKQTEQKTNPSKEWALIEKVMLASVQEQRRARRWSIFFRILTFSYLLILLFLLKPTTLGPAASIGPHAAVVEVTGLIAEGAEASAENIIQGLAAAFEDKNTLGVILKINSPGGSAVQSDYVYQEIKRLRNQYPQIPVYAVIGDLGASGAYYIASAADEIYANRASILGSIGVVMSSFGLVEAIDKLGIERRLFTAGEHKGFMDPFSPIDATEREHVQQMLDLVHRQFIDRVKAGRGDRLIEDARLFSGLVWTGESAFELGLIDGMADSRELARDLLQTEHLVDYTHKPSPFERFAKQLGAGMGETLAGFWGLSGQDRINF